MRLSCFERNGGTRRTDRLTDGRDATRNVSSREGRLITLNVIIQRASAMVYTIHIRQVNIVLVTGAIFSASLAAFIARSVFPILFSSFHERQSLH